MPAPQPRFPLGFAVSGQNPRVDLSLRVREDGAFDADVMTEWSLPQGAPALLGTFAGALEPDVLAQLAAVAGGSAGGGGGVNAPDSVARLVSAGGGAMGPAVGDPEALAALDEAIADAVLVALAAPVAAIRGEARRTARGGELVLTGSGSAPFPLLLFAPDGAGFWARTWIDTPRGPAWLLHEVVAGLADSGAIPSGERGLAPGDSVALPLPAGLPETAVSGGWLAWRTGQGPERRVLSATWSLPAK